MNRNHILVIAASGLVIFAAYDLWKFHKEEQAIRDQIFGNAEKEIDAMTRAAKKVLANIHEGKYRNTPDPFTRMHNDLDFYTIISR